MTASRESTPVYAAVDVVGVFTQNFTQIFKEARAIKAMVNPRAKLMDHPVENGTTTTDHVVFLPIEIELSLVLASQDFRSTYQSISQYYAKSTLLLIKTNSGIFTNQVIQSMPHDEDPEQFDALVIALKLRQVQFATAQFTIVPRNPANTSTVDRGVQTGTTPTAVKVSSLRDLTK